MDKRGYLKILTITGTRPELIRLSVIIKKLDIICKHVLIFTNQNFDPNLKDIFFKDLEIRQPDYFLNQNRFNNNSEFLSNAFKEFGHILDVEKPDKVLVLGDTNSGLVAMLAAKKGIPVYHMEAGNRCFDKNVPEETNRRIIDSFSTYNLPYTEQSKQNLLKEGYHKNYVFKTGNPLFEVLKHYESKINKRFNIYDYVLVTIHRTENVDNHIIATNIVKAINSISDIYKVTFPMHPRTKDQFEKHGLKFTGRVEITNPAGYFDFIYDLKHAKLVITDSGSVPEETTIFHVPCIIVRNFIERQELIENGSVILAGTKTENILSAASYAMEMDTAWPDIDDYHKLNVSETVIRLLLGKS